MAERRDKVKTINNSRDVLTAAIQTYGGEKQTWKCQEEIGEYMQAIGKLNSTESALKGQRHKAYDNLQEEIADCIIMFEQMRLLYGPEEVDKWIDYKLSRLQLHLYEK